MAPLRKSASNAASSHPGAQLSMQVPRDTRASRQGNHNDQSSHQVHNAQNAKQLHARCPVTQLQAQIACADSHKCKCKRQGGACETTTQLKVTSFCSATNMHSGKMATHGGAHHNLNTHTQTHASKDAAFTLTFRLYSCMCCCGLLPSTVPQWSDSCTLNNAIQRTLATVTLSLLSAPGQRYNGRRCCAQSVPRSLHLSPGTSPAAAPAP